MATINKKTGALSGKLGENIYYDVNGIQAVRSVPKGLRISNSPLVIEVKAITSELSGLWRELPDETKALWEEYAAAQGSASEVESSQPVSYKWCPIKNYPPRPRKMSGHNAFVGANATGLHCGFGIRLYPPLDVRIPPAPMIDCKYERSSGELLVVLDTPAISKPKKRAVYKAVIWLTASREEKGRTLYLAMKRKFDFFDITPQIASGSSQRIEKRYKGVEQTYRYFDYKPVAFSSQPYLRLHIGAQIMMAANELTSPVKSSGNWKRYWLLNGHEYVQFEDLIEADYLRNIAILKDASDKFLSRLAAKRHELAAAKE